MSRVGKMPIDVVEGVKFSIKDNVIEVTGPLGKLSCKVSPSIEIVNENTRIILKRENDSKINRSLHGLMRSLVNNMFIGVTKGFEKKLTLLGLGYKAEVKDNKLVMALGFSHPVEFDLPEGIAIKVVKQEVTISGVDKQLVGETAARIRRIKKPEPYKGKGIRYIDEVVKRKAGKTAVGTGFGGGAGGK